MWRGSGTQKHRAGRAGKRPHLYCSGKDTQRIFISWAAYRQSDAQTAQSRTETLKQGCLLALSLLLKPDHKEVRVGENGGGASALPPCRDAWGAERGARMHALSSGFDESAVWW